MKTCSICNKEHQRPRAHRCLKCQAKVCCKNYSLANRDKIKSYRKIYNIENREKLKAQQKASIAKNREHYSKKNRENSYKKRGLPADYKPWKKKNGEGSITPEGYKLISIKGHPNSRNKKGAIFEHRVVMENYLGRLLHKHEVVHHINGNRLDNRIENLELWSKSQPPGQRLEDKIKWAIDFLEQYDHKVIIPSISKELT